MAITIIDNPQTFSPAFSPQIFVVSSNNTAQPNFKYIADIYIDGVTTPAYLSIEKSPDAVTGLCVFDVGLIASYVGSDISKTDTGFTTCPNSYAAYTVKFGEQYGPSSGVTNYRDLTVDSKRYAWNGVVDPLPFINYNETNFVMGAGSVDYLTEAPETQYVEAIGYRFLHTMTATSGSVYQAEIDTFDSAGNSIASFRVKNNFQAVADDNSKFIRFAAGPAQLNLIPGGDFLFGSQPVIGTNVAYYEIQFLDSSNAARSNRHRYYVVDYCTRFEVQRLHFKGKLGGFDSFDFTLRVDRPTDIDRASYRRPYGSAPAGNWSYAASDRAFSDFDLRARDRLILNSDWLTTEQATWLHRNLKECTEAYLDDRTYGLIFVKVMDTAYSEWRPENGGQYQLTVELQYGFQRISQKA